MAREGTTRAETYGSTATERATTTKAQCVYCFFFNLHFSFRGFQEHFLLPCLFFFLWHRFFVFIFLQGSRLAAPPPSNPAVVVVSPTTAPTPAVVGAVVGVGVGQVPQDAGHPLMSEALMSAAPFVSHSFASFL